MRKQKEEHLRDIISEQIAHEIMKQTDAIVEIIAQDEIRKSGLDLDTTYDQPLITDFCGMDCFNKYLQYKSGIYQIAHYHYEDCLYVITNQKEVRKNVANALQRVDKLFKQGYIPDERN